MWVKFVAYTTTELEEIFKTVFINYTESLTSNNYKYAINYLTGSALENCVKYLETPLPSQEDIKFVITGMKILARGDRTAYVELIASTGEKDDLAILVEFILLDNNWKIKNTTQIK